MEEKITLKYVADTDEFCHKLEVILSEITKIEDALLRIKNLGLELPLNLNIKTDANS